MRREIHPTKEQLIVTASQLLENSRPDEIQVDQLLQLSGISKGSLYHHFEDLADVLELAQVRRFVHRAIADVEAISALFHESKNRENFLAGLEKITEASQSPDNRQFRLERVAIIALSRGNPRLAQRLGQAQQQTTDALTDLVREAQHKGWLSNAIDAQTLAVFIQAYTIGRVVDDVALSQVSPESWNDLIRRVLQGALI